MRFIHRTLPAPTLISPKRTITPQELLEAAAHPDPKKQGEQLCEAHFWFGEYLMIKGLPEEAAQEFQTAADTCPVHFFEYWGAKSELQRLRH